jgi:hypothetical protein
MKGLVPAQALASTVSISGNLHQQILRGACKERKSLVKFCEMVEEMEDSILVESSSRLKGLKRPPVVSASSVT